MTKTKNKGPRIIEEGVAEETTPVDAESDRTDDFDEAADREHRAATAVDELYREPAPDPDTEHAPETRALDAHSGVVVNHGPSADVAKNDAIVEEKPPRKPREKRTLDGQLLGLRASYAKHVEKLTAKRDNLKTQLEAVDLELGNAQRQLERIGRTLDSGDENETAALQRLTPPEPVPSVPDPVPDSGTGASSAGTNA